MRFEGKHFVIVGGGSGIGYATAEAALAQGARVTIAGRSTPKLNAAFARLGGGSNIAAAAMDMTDETAVRTFFASLEDASVDALVITASQVAHGPFASAQTADIMAMISSKLMGPFVVAREALPKLAPDASITFFSGVLSRRPGTNGAGLAAVNAGIEGLARALALELAPDVRVNVVAPGMTDSDAYAGMSEAARTAMFKSVAASLPVGRVAAPPEIAEAVLFLAGNGFTTGHVLDVDGGHLIAS